MRVSWMFKQLCFSAPLYEGVQGGQEISPTLCISVLDGSKCLISQYCHFKPTDWEIPVKLAYSRSAVCLQLIFLLCFQTLRQEQPTENCTNEVNVPQFSNFAQKNFRYIENTTIFITEELELNPEKAMQSTGKINDTLPSLSKCIRTLHGTLYFFGSKRK